MSKPPGDIISQSLAITSETTERRKDLRLGLFARRAEQADSNDNGGHSSGNRFLGLQNADASGAGRIGRKRMPSFCLEEEKSLETRETTPLPHARQKAQQLKSAQAVSLIFERTRPTAETDGTAANASKHAENESFFSYKRIRNSCFDFMLRCFCGRCSCWCLRPKGKRPSSAFRKRNITKKRQNYF